MHFISVIALPGLVPGLVVSSSAAAQNEVKQRGGVLANGEASGERFLFNNPIM